MSLHGLKVLELAGLAPSPYCGLILKQHGADVIRVDKHTGSPKDPSGGAMGTGKKSIALNLKSGNGKETFITLCKGADVLIDCYRPGVMEKLGLGPQELMAANPRLIYARLTGWGQEGPMALTAGHDINYIGLTGAIAAANYSFPANLLGDFAGGGMLCALGIMMALYERNSSGLGQVIDVAMVDGVAHIATFVYRMRAAGAWTDTPGTNVLDNGAPWYGTHLCKDGKYVAIGCIEPHFYKILLEGMGLKGDKTLPKQMNKEKWPELRARLAAEFSKRSRDEWCEIFSPNGKYADACLSPVLSLDEVGTHPHMAARGVIKKGPLGENDLIPGPAPKLSRTPGAASPMGKGVVPRDGENTTQVLSEFGFSMENITRLIDNGDVVQYKPRPKM